MFKTLSSWKLTSVIFLVHAIVQLLIACVAAYAEFFTVVPVLAVSALAMFGLAYGFNRMSKNDEY